MLVHRASCQPQGKCLKERQVAPGTQATLNSLKDPSRRPVHLRDPLLDELTSFVPESRFVSDQDQFCRNLRSSRRGAAGGPSGMTTEHLRCLLVDQRAMQLYSELASRVSRAQVPREVI